MTERQMAAVQSVAPNILMIAGAGSGKTSTLVGRVEHLAKQGADPSGFAIITFTNSAATELKDRLAKIGLTPGYAGTLHGLMVRLLYRFGSHIGLPQEFAVIDEDQTTRLVEGVMADLRYRKPQKALIATIAEWEQRPKKAVMTDTDLAAAAFYGVLRREGLLTFDQVLSRGLELIRTHPATWPFSHLFVDEIQDSGVLDAQIYNAVPAKFMVGDPRQAIYGFRGGSVRFILDLASRQGIEVHQVPDNWRSDKQIVEASNRLAANMPGAKLEPLISHGQAGTVAAFHAKTASREIVDISEMIMTAKGSVAVLLRTNALVAEWADALEELGIEVQRRKRTKLPVDWGRAKDYLALLANPDNDRLAYQAIEHSRGKEVADKVKLAALTGLTTINKVALKLCARPPVQDAPELLAKMGIGPESIQTVRLASGLLPEESSMADLLMAVSRADLATEEVGQGVAVMTVHAAKGREWDTVFVPAFEQELWPGKRGDIEEERRLAYVAMTRARHNLILSSAGQRRAQFGPKPMEDRTPSQFITEAGL